MAVFEVPLSPAAQRFPITLSGTTYALTLAWRNAGGAGWVLDIADAGGQPILRGVPLVAGADLLAQHRHLGIPGRLYVQTDGDPDAPPAFGNLGLASHLYYVT